MKTVQVLLFITSVVLLSGCGMKHRRSGDVQYYLLNLERSGSDISPSADICLQVHPCSVAPSFAGRSLIYRTGPVRYEQDYYNLFLTRPENQITHLLRSWFRSAGIRDCGLIQGTDLDKYMLEPHVEVLCADFKNAQKPIAIVQIHVLLTHFDKEASSVKTLLNKTYTQQTALPEKPAGAQVVEAMSASLRQILQQLEDDIINVI